MAVTERWFEATWSPSFPQWLEDQGVSVAFTTYQSGKLFTLGRAAGAPPESLSIVERNFPHCMGMCVSSDVRSLWVSTRFQIWRLERTGAAASPYVPAAADGTPDASMPAWCRGGHDFAYVPRVGWTTGHLDVHDMALDTTGAPVFVNTLFGCLATVSERGSFRPLWRPPFLSALVPEDRCHLNGLAMRDGAPAFVTLAGRSNVLDGWREHRRTGGCVLDVASGEVACGGLSMPHSPRLHDGRLWLLNSGTGELGFVDETTARFEGVTFGPGFLRGLSIHADYGVVTVSKPRGNVFRDLVLDDRLSADNAAPMAGLLVIDLRTGRVIAWFRIEDEALLELYDAVILPGVVNPVVIGFKSDDIERLVVIDDSLMRISSPG